MNAKKMTIWLVVVVVLAGGISVEASVGKWLREKADAANERMQKELEENPDIQKKINKGIDSFVDNVVDFADPDGDSEASRRARQATKDSMQVILNPNSREKEEKLDSLMDNVTGRKSSKSSSYPSQNSSNSSSSSNPSSSYSRSRNSNYGSSYKSSKSYTGDYSGFWGNVNSNFSGVIAGKELDQYGMKTDKALRIMIFLAFVMLLMSCFMFLLNVLYRRRNTFSACGIGFYLLFAVIVVGLFYSELPQGLRTEIVNGLGGNVLPARGINRETFLVPASLVGGPSLFLLSLLIYGLLPTKKSGYTEVEEARSGRQENEKRIAEAAVKREPPVEPKSIETTPLVAAQSEKRLSQLGLERRVSLEPKKEGAAKSGEDAKVEVIYELASSLSPAARQILISRLVCS